METKLVEFLQENYGYFDFRDGQKEVILGLLNKQNVLALLATGTGKSLCYQFFAKYTKQRVLIISPLLSLMQDQVEQLRHQGEKRVIALNSMLTVNKRHEVLQNLTKYQYVYVSPEFLQNKEILRALKALKWGLVVVDEAHCISQWGHDFRPHYLQLGFLREQLQYPLTLALSATVTFEVQNDILNSLKLKEQTLIVKRSIDRANICLACQTCLNDQQKKEELQKWVAKLKGPGLIYFSSKKKADQLAEMLQKNLNIACSAYHADLDLKERYKIQRQFIDNQLQVICATSAFGMGINKGDIAYVIHYHMPASIENYLQEIGRAGRNGQKSVALLLYTPTDTNLQVNLMTTTLPSKKDILTYYRDQQALLDPVKADLIAYYYNNAYTSQTLIEIFEQRRLKKLKDLVAMKNYVELQKCKRQYLLDYFAEKKTIKHDNNCCQSGERLDLTAFTTLRQEIKTIKTPTSYQQILKYLFKE